MGVTADRLAHFSQKERAELEEQKEEAKQRSNAAEEESKLNVMALLKIKTD